MRIHLQLLNGEKMDSSIDLDSFIIGRSSKCEVVIPHEGMSRQHCQIEVIDGEVYITDLGSTNGVFINGEKIEPHKKTPYATYLTLAFGAVQSMQIQLTEPTKSLSYSSIVAAKKDLPKETPSANNNTVMTKTKNLQEPSKTSEKNPLKKPESKINFRSVAINLMALFIIGAAAWWYMENKGNNSGPNQEVTEETSAE